MAGRFFGRFGRRSGGRERPRDLAIADPRFDDWEVVREFEDMDSARSWYQHLREAGIEAVLSSDWPLDRFGRGEIYLQVPQPNWSEAEDILSALD